LVRVVRDGAIDAMHLGHVAVVTEGGTLAVGHGDPDVEIYPRSALKPFQAAASLALAGGAVPDDEVAIMAASHTGGAAHQAAAQRVLRRAGLRAGALRCPPALPTDAAMLRKQPVPTRLAHNCSGKHAGFLLATTSAGARPACYLDADDVVQRAVRATIGDACGTEPRGPGVDGCGAPAWRLPLSALARGFLALLTADGQLGRVAQAMRVHPQLVGGEAVVDTLLMQAEPAIVAKRGAEGVLAVAADTPSGPVGIAIKVSDGGVRAVGPVAAAVLDAVGLRGAPGLVRPAVLGGGRPRGAVEVDGGLRAALDRLR
jgi:L-asparaginase II